ncbi:hypothetical protein RBU61_00035 [Tissierella sp. MB52-C2]|uniref:hypothetical protein n=1 Tax=Tissierella sp. MB52-C2 TaxID=3070999 RepID=UPI00280BBFA4|nr:hypothetical protein [Tissierella sp. MB52-C2]WMM25082.1 hypothetical protein RBU61_00035 [Tissierella sp. MB52-C2]
MSILTVTNLSHGFGDREILKNVSFRLLKGEARRINWLPMEKGKSSFMKYNNGKIRTR